MRIIGLIVAVLMLGGCASKPDPGDGAAGYLTETPGRLSPQDTALRVGQQFAAAGVSNQARLQLLHHALYQRNRAPSYNWSVEPSGRTWVVAATLTANERPPTVFKWIVDFSKPPESVCVAANREAEQLGQLHFKLDETGLEDYLGPKLGPSAPTQGTAAPSKSR